NAFQRLYDMIISFGTRKYTEYKKEITHYNFFDDPIGGGKDAVYGLDVPLMKLVQVLKAAALGYGPERRVILLHGPVGSAKSTICRLLKKGLEYYSRTPEGALYTFGWAGEGLGMLGIPAEMAEPGQNTGTIPCPMHEEPLHLIPEELRGRLFDDLNAAPLLHWRIAPDGDLCPSCRHIYNQLMLRYDGDWGRVIEHVRVRRLLISER